MEEGVLCSSVATATSNLAQRLARETAIKARTPWYLLLLTRVYILSTAA